MGFTKGRKLNCNHLLLVVAIGLAIVGFIGIANFEDAEDYPLIQRQLEGEIEADKVCSDIGVTKEMVTKSRFYGNPCKWDSRTYHIINFISS